MEGQRYQGRGDQVDKEPRMEYHPKTRQGGPEVRVLSRIIAFICRLGEDRRGRGKDTSSLRVHIQVCCGCPKEQGGAR